jgi:NADPH:quinone reductase
MNATMKAVGYQAPLPIDDPNSLLDITLPVPKPEPHDLLVQVKAVSVNPVDIKVRQRAKPEGADYKVLGWDVAGVVTQVGTDCVLFREGDEVFYAGSLVRQGANAEFHLVDERIVGHKPKSLDFAGAAALPLTTITAWELLFDRFRIIPGKSGDAGRLLITGAAGGVGSILIQLARRLTTLTVIATASRETTKRWCIDLGAHHVIDHSHPLQPQLERIGIPTVEYIASLNATDQHFPGLLTVLAPQGHFGLIDDPATLDVLPLKQKSAALHWEFMFTRSLFQTADLTSQGRLLNDAASLLDAGVLRTTATDAFGKINAENLKKAHTKIESGRSQGKLVLEGF